MIRYDGGGDGIVRTADFGVGENKCRCEGEHNFLRPKRMNE